MPSTAKVRLTALGKLNQASPFIRHGIVSSVFPFPTALPHGFTIDVMQQGGSSGSPVLRSDGTVVGMMSSGVPEWRVAQSQQATLAYSMNTNISIAEPAHIIQKALKEFPNAQPVKTDNLPTLTEVRARHPKPNKSEELTWDRWIERKPNA